MSYTHLHGLTAKGQAARKRAQAIAKEGRRLNRFARHARRDLAEAEILAEDGDKIAELDLEIQRAEAEVNGFTKEKRKILFPAVQLRADDPSAEVLAERLKVLNRQRARHYRENKKKKKKEQANQNQFVENTNFSNSKATSSSSK